MGTLFDALVELIENLILWANEMAQEGKKKKTLAPQAWQPQFDPWKVEGETDSKKMFSEPNVCVLLHNIHKKY